MLSWLRYQRKSMLIKTQVAGSQVILVRAAFGLIFCLDLVFPIRVRHVDRAGDSGTRPRNLKQVKSQVSRAAILRSLGLPCLKLFSPQVGPILFRGQPPPSPERRVHTRPKAGSHGCEP